MSKLHACLPMLLVPALGLSVLTVGCEGEKVLNEDTTVKTKDDGTVVKESERTVEKADGSVVKEESKSVDNPDHDHDKDDVKVDVDVDKKD